MRFGLACSSATPQLRLALSHRDLAPARHSHRMYPRLQQRPDITACACIHVQVKQWQGDDKEMPSEDWGWKISGNQVLPVMNDLPRDPQSLLQFRCNCSSDCSALICTCRKNNMQCSSPCGQCKGSLDDDSEDSKSELNVYSKCGEAEKWTHSREYHYYQC